jgi:hypothetical protein
MVRQGGGITVTASDDYSGCVRNGSLPYDVMPGEDGRQARMSAAQIMHWCSDRLRWFMGHAYTATPPPFFGSCGTPTHVCFPENPKCRFHGSSGTRKMTTTHCPRPMHPLFSSRGRIPPFCSNRWHDLISLFFCALPFTLP